MMNEILRCRPWIEAALEYSHGTHEFIDVVDAILSGKMQLWSNEHGCAVTEVIDYPRKRMLHVFLAGGSKEAISDLSEPALKWAKDIGCSDLTLTGRKGWTKALKNDGWTTSHVMMIKEVI